MALNSPSKWNPTGFGESGEPDPETGLTGHQQRAVGARHPANLQQPNEVEPQKDGTTTTAVDRGRLGQSQQKQREQASPVPEVSDEVRRISSNIGNFGYLLQEKVNKLLTGAAKNIGMSDGSLFNTSKDGQFSIADNVAANIDPTVRQKAAEQESLKRALQPYTEEIGGRIHAKSFDKVVRELLGDDEDAGYVVQLINTMDQLQKSGAGNSPEARAARQQLEATDRTGMISGLFRAKQQYEQYMGIPGSETEPMKWYGDEGTDGYSAIELSQLSADKLKTEVEQALTFSSGLFGGDFESSLERLFDTESANIKESNRKKEAIRNQLSNSFKSFVDEAGDEFQEYRKSFENVFKTVGGKIVEELNKTGQGLEARMWAEALAGGKMQDLIYQLLNDPNSGLSKKQRDEITKWIGKAGEASGGQLFGWLNSLATTGQFYVNIPSPDGEEKDKEVLVKPSADQQLNILNILNQNLPEEQKQTKLKELIRSMSVGTGTIGGLLQDAMSMAAKTGDTDAALEVLQDSVVESMKTFANSFTEDVVRRYLGIKDDAWDKMDSAAKSAAVVKVLKENPNILEDGMSDLYSKAREVKLKWGEHITTAETNITTRKTELEKEAVFDKDGNLAGGRLFELKGKIAEGITGTSNTLVTQIGNSFYTNMSSYEKLIKNQPYIAHYIQNGEITHEEIVALAKAYSVQKAMESLKSRSPELHRLITNKIAQAIGFEYSGDTGLENMKAWIQGAIKSKDTKNLTDSMTNIYDKFISPFIKGEFTEEIMKPYMATVQTSPSSELDFSVKLHLDRYALQGTQISDAAGKVKERYDNLLTAQSTIAALKNGLDMRVFDPSNIFKMAVETAKQREVNTPPFFSEETMESLGLTTADIQYNAQGVPYVNMGGMPVELTEENILKIAADIAKKFEGAEILDVGGLDVPAVDLTPSALTGIPDLPLKKEEAKKEDDKDSGGNGTNWMDYLGPHNLYRAMNTLSNIPQDLKDSLKKIYPGPMGIILGGSARIGTGGAFTENIPEHFEQMKDVVTLLVNIADGKVTPSDVKEAVDAVIKMGVTSAIEVLTSPLTDTIQSVAELFGWGDANSTTPKVHGQQAWIGNRLGYWDNKLKKWIPTNRYRTEIRGPKGIPTGNYTYSGSTDPIPGDTRTVIADGHKVMQRYDGKVWKEINRTADTPSPVANPNVPPRKNDPAPSVPASVPAATAPRPAAVNTTKQTGGRGGKN